jgi:hypothetical protein
MKRNLHSALYNFINNKLIDIFIYLYMFYILTFSVTILFATRIQCGMKNLTRSSTYAR